MFSFVPDFGHPCSIALWLSSYEKYKALTAKDLANLHDLPVGTRRRPLNNCWVRLNVRRAEKSTGIPFAGPRLSRIVVPGIVKFVGSARIGVFGTAKIAIDVPII